MKYLYLIFFLPFSVWAMNIPVTNLFIDADQYKVILGQKGYKLADKVTMKVPPEVIGGTINASVELSWGTCKLKSGSGGLNISLAGINNDDIGQLSFEFDSSLSMTTALWLTMEPSGDSQPSGSMIYECPLMGAEWYPLRLDNEVISNLIISIQATVPSCNITTKPSVKLPPISQINESSSIKLPITVKCEGFQDNPPEVSLLLKGSKSTNEGYLFEDDNIIFEMLYGSEISGKAGQLWKADNIAKYPLGKASTTLNAMPMIKVIKKAGAAAGRYESTATVTINIE